MQARASIPLIAVMIRRGSLFKAFFAILGRLFLFYPIQPNLILFRVIVWGLFTT